MIGFVGLSHLGVVSSVAAASKWFRVIAYDPRGPWISGLNEGRLPFAEPGLDEALRSQRPRIQFTANLKDLAACDLVYFSVDIQTDEKNQSDASGLTELVRTTLPHLKAGTTLVVLSQVAPGFTRALSRTGEVKNFRVSKWLGKKGFEFLGRNSLFALEGFFVAGLILLFCVERITSESGERIEKYDR